MAQDLNYDEALALLRAHNQTEGLVKHGMAVAAATAAYARTFGEDELTWRIAGLLHDVDYEKHPTIEEHGKVGAEWVKDAGYPDHIVHAVIAHNDYHGVPRDDLLSRAVFACDELTGLITATALVRPNKSIHGLEASSVRKKMKDKAFARGVNRDDIVKGADELGVDLNEHITFVIAAMDAEAAALGLEGTPA
ncbi:MAG TPA: HDIG domain-containing protein [Ktedonobacterales bacterium]|nr:HDIG domain-containing protein [Ktedonobacterales bacterium]